jgi:hypothetical protein
MRRVLKSILKAILPADSVYRLWCLHRNILDAIRGAPARARLKFTRERYLKINLARRDRRVVFVSEVPTQREAKLAYGLKRAGWDVIQLYRGKTVLTDFSSVAEARQFHHSWEAVELAHLTRCRVFHNFSWAGDATSVRLTDNKPGKVIFDFYDYVFSMVDGLPEREKEMRGQVALQTYCIEQADALCCRDLQLQYRRRETQRGRGKPIILFPEYCWNKHPLSAPPNNQSVRVVQIGTMGMETMGEKDIGSYRVFERLVGAGCHLDVYLHPYFPKLGTPEFLSVFREYVALAKRTGLVNFHSPVPPHRIVDEITHYDFGASVNNGFTFDLPWSQHNVDRLPFCGSSRMFDYLDAGLGMILHRQLRFMYKTFRQYGIVRDATDLIRASDLKAALGDRPAKDIVSLARTNLSIERNISRLIAFYEALA